MRTELELTYTGDSVWGQKLVLEEGKEQKARERLMYFEQEGIEMWGLQQWLRQIEKPPLFSPFN